MTTPCSPNQIGLLDVRNELGNSGQITMNDADVRALAGKPSGQITMDDLRCKSSLCVTGIQDILPALGYNTSDNNNGNIYVKNGFSNFSQSYQYQSMKTVTGEYNTSPSTLSHYLTEAYKAQDGNSSTFFRMSANNSTALARLSTSSASGFINVCMAVKIDVNPADCGYTNVRVKDFKVMKAYFDYSNTAAFRVNSQYWLFSSAGTALPSGTATRATEGYVAKKYSASGGVGTFTYNGTELFTKSTNPWYTAPFYVYICWYLEGQRTIVAGGWADAGNPREYDYLIELEFS